MNIEFLFYVIGWYVVGVATMAFSIVFYSKRFTFTDLAICLFAGVLGLITPIVFIVMHFIDDKEFDIVLWEKKD